MTNPRVPFQMTSERKPLRPPKKGKMLIAHVVLNVEYWPFDQPMPRKTLSTPHGMEPVPDIPNYSWAEYGLRCGMPRILDLLAQMKLPASANLNSTVIDQYPTVAQAMLKAKWEFIGHGYTQKNMQKVPDEREDIRRTTEAIAAFTGKRPRGWLGPGLTETWETPDLLVEAGYEYVCDWVLDDQPVQLRTRTQPIVNIPYTQECNDVAMMLIQHHAGAEYHQRAIDQFDQLHADAEGSARVMALVVHPYIMGAPHRLKYLVKVFEHMARREGVLYWTGEQILDWYRAQRNAA